MTEEPHHPGPMAPDQGVDSTADLLLRAKGGELGAEGLLFRRYQPILRRLAHGRLPAMARDLKDTDDLVQETLVLAFRRLGSFEYRREGAFLAYSFAPHRIRVDVDPKRDRLTPAPSLLLGPAFPNPTRDLVSMRISVPVESDITLGLYDVAGRLLQKTPAHLAPGSHVLSLDLRRASPGSAGVYFARVQVGEHILKRTVVVVR